MVCILSCKQSTALLLSACLCVHFNTKGRDRAGERKEDRELIEFTAAAENTGLIFTAAQDSFPQQAAGWGSECWFSRLRRSFFRQPCGHSTPLQGASLQLGAILVSCGVRKGFDAFSSQCPGGNSRAGAEQSWGRSEHVNHMKNEEACWLLIFPGILVMLNMAGLPRLSLTLLAAAVGTMQSSFPSSQASSQPWEANTEPLTLFPQHLSLSLKMHTCPGAGDSAVIREQTTT